MDKSVFLKENFPQTAIKAAKLAVEEHRVIRVVRAYENDAEIVRCKVPNHFNYVRHASVTIKKGDIKGFFCDCDKGKNGEACEHCAALIMFLAEKEPAPSCEPVCAEPSPPPIPPVQPIPPIPPVQPIPPIPPVQPIPPIPPLTPDRDEFDGISFGDILSGDIHVPKPFPDVSIGEDIQPFSGEEFSEYKDDADDIVFDSTVSRGMKILLGRDEESGRDIFWYPNDTEQLFHVNTGIIGTMGTGKTQFTKSLITQIWKERANNFAGCPIGMLIFDYKGDYNEDKPDFVNAVNARIIKPYRMPYNPLALNLRKSGVPRLPVLTANSFTDTVGKIYNLGAKQRNVLCKCIQAAYAHCGILSEDPATWTNTPPTFDTVYRIYEQAAEGKDFGLLDAIMFKLNELCLFEPDPRRAIPLMNLLNGVVVINISGYDSDIQNLVAALTIDHFYSQMMTLGSSKTDGRFRALRKLILVDEADNFMSGGYPSLKKIMKEGREFGVGVILSTQSLKHFDGSDEDYSRYILTWVVHNTSDMSRRNVEYVFGYDVKCPDTDMTFASIKKLAKHHSMIRIPGESPIEIRDRAFWEIISEQGEN